MAMRDIYFGYLRNPQKLEEDLLKVVKIDDLALEDEKRDQASLYAYWAVLTSIAETEYQNQKRLIEVEIWPSVCANVRSVLHSQGIKDTKDKVEEMAYVDQAYRNAASTRANLVHVLDIFKKIENALWQRKDMLQSMSRRETRERNATPKSSEVQELSDYVDRTLKKDVRTIEELEALATSVIGTKHAR